MFTFVDMILYCYKLVLGACCKKTKLIVPKVSDGCYAWSHYGGGCDICKSNWNDCKCKLEEREETGCENCMNYLSSCTCQLDDDDDVDDVDDDDDVDDNKESKESKED